jgi:hypothetical protein
MLLAGTSSPEMIPCACKYPLWLVFVAGGAEQYPADALGKAVPLPAGTLTQLHVRFWSPAAGGGQWFTARYSIAIVDPGATAPVRTDFSCEIEAGGSACDTGSGSLPVRDGQAALLELDPTGSPAVAPETYVSFSVVFRPS